MKNPNIDDLLEPILTRDPRYTVEAYFFVRDALDHTVRQLATPRHISGQELLDGMRVHATRLFGPLAAQVWRTWGVRSTLDWGRIVFNLVESELLRRQDTDTIEDFRDGYDFDEVFVRAYEPKLPTELGALPRSPAQDVGLEGGEGELA